MKTGRNRRLICLLTVFALLAASLCNAVCLGTFAESGEITVLNDETGENGGFCAEISDEKAKVGSFSYKTTPGSSNHDYWMIRTKLPKTVDIKETTKDGTDGALRFWVWVEKRTDVILNWNGSQVQLGEDWDKNVYVWSGWDTQITADGWNEIILPFEKAGKVGKPDSGSISYINIRNGNARFKTTVYIDDIRIGAVKEEPEPETDENLILNDEIGENGGFCAEVTDEKAKVGSFSYKTTPGSSNHDYWMIRTKLPKTVDIKETTKDGTDGALRFWVWVEKRTDVILNWNGSQVQLGEDWDKNVYVWAGWDTQITADGWNEIILPFEKAGKVGKPDSGSISYINIRNGNARFKTTVYIDDIRIGAVKEEQEPETDENLILNDEIGENGGFCAEISDEKAKVGSFSYKTTPGSSNRDYWMIRTKLPKTVDIKETTKDGTDGALRFWVWVEKRTDVILNWNGSQVQLGEDWDKNVYVWAGWDTQITADGWNEIILPFEKAGKVGKPDSGSISYINIRNGNARFKTTVYIDDIRIGAVKEEPEPETDENLILNDEIGENGGFCAEISDEKAKVGSFSYKATPGSSNRDYWMIRTKLKREMDITQKKKGGLHFWVYVNSAKEVKLNWNGSQAQFGEEWDKNVYIWSGWDTQIISDGWNEIYLPFEKAGRAGTPDDSKISYINIRMGNARFNTAVFIDDIRIAFASSAVMPEIPDDIILSDEAGESAGFCATLSDEQVKSGNFAYKACTGINNHDFWFVRTDSGLPRTLDISRKTADGTKGAVSFWIWVDSKRNVIDNWKGSQLQLGEGRDKNVYIWSGWDTQIRNDGWNRIVLNFSAAGKNGTPRNNALKYLNIRMGNALYKTTVYIDDIRITSDEYKINDKPTVDGAKMFQPFESMSKIIFETNFVEKIWLDTDDKTQGDSSLSFTTKKGMFTFRYEPAEPVDASKYNCLEFDLYVPATDFFDFSAASLELTSSGKCDVNEMSWGFGNLQLTPGWNHIVFSFERAAFTTDFKNARDIDLTAINYMRFYALEASAYIGRELTWKIDNMVFTNNGLPPVEKKTYSVVNNTAYDVKLTAAEGILPDNGVFTVNDKADISKTLLKRADGVNYILLDLSFYKDDIEYLLPGNAKITLAKDKKISAFEKVYVYRIDVNGSVSEVKNVNKSSDIAWEEDRKFCTYMLTDAPLDISVSGGAGAGAKLKYITVAVAAALVLGAAALTAVILKKRVQRGKKG